MNIAVSNRNAFSGPTRDTSVDMYCRKQVISFRKLGLLICFKFGFQNHFMLLNTLTSTSYFPCLLYLSCAEQFCILFHSQQISEKERNISREEEWTLGILTFPFLWSCWIFCPLLFSTSPEFFPFSVMQLEAGCLELPDNLTSSFNLMFFRCFRAGVEIESSSWAQL